MAFPPFTRLSGPAYNAPTFGRFYPVYHPDLGLLNITVKVLWEWIDHDNGHPPWNLASRQAFQTAFCNNVPRDWNMKWRFRCTHPGFTQYTAEPRFYIAAGTVADHHFRIQVRNCGGQSHLNTAHGYLVLHNTDNDEYDNINPPNLLNPASLFGMSRGGVIQSERRKVEQILAPVQNITLARTGSGWAIDPASRLPLEQFARGLARVGALMPKYPISIVTSSGKAGKAQALANAVLNFLQSKGVDPHRYPIATQATTGRRKWKLRSSATATAAIVLSDDDNTVAANWQYRYKVASHEFGHCLGLPDEYCTYPPGPIHQAHNAWSALCAQAGTAPNGYPQFNSSIMSCGWVTKACHFVTVWDALGNLTSQPPHNVPKASWVIERGSQPDVL